MEASFHSFFILILKGNNKTVLWLRIFSYFVEHKNYAKNQSVCLTKRKLLSAAFAYFSPVYLSLFARAIKASLSAECGFYSTSVEWVSVCQGGEALGGLHEGNFAVFLSQNCVFGFFC